MKSRTEQIAANSEAVAVLLKHDDALTQVREIDHFAYFPNTAARTAFIERCEAVGFHLRRTSDPGGPLTNYGAILFHKDVPDEDVLEKVTSLLLDLAEECGGEYDGWETQLLK